MVLQRIEGHGQSTGSVQIQKTDALSEFMKSSGERFSGIAGKAIIKRMDREYSDAREARFAKSSTKLFGILSNMRSMNESTPVRIQEKDRFIREGLRDGSLKGWEANLLRKITVMDLDKKLYENGEWLLTDERGNVFNDVGMPRKRPSQRADRGRIESHAKEEAANGIAVVKVAPRASQAAEDTIVSGLPKNPIKHKYYSQSASRFNKRTLALSQYFQNLAGEELYASVQNTDDIPTFQKMAFGEIRAHISGIMNEYKGMITGLVDDPEASVSLKDIKHYTRALKSDIQSMYDRNPGAKLALGSGFTAQLEEVFKDIDTGTDLLVDNVFKEGTVGTATLQAKKATNFMNATHALKVAKVISKFPDTKVEMEAHLKLSQAVSALAPAALATDQIPTYTTLVKSALEPSVKARIPIAIANLKKFGTPKEGKKLSRAAKGILLDEIRFLMDESTVLSRGGKYDDIVKAIEDVMGAFTFEDKAEEKKIRGALDDFAEKAEKAEPDARSWMDSVEEGVGSFIRGGSNLFDKWWDR